MSNTLYPLRNFEVPPGFAILPLSTDVYTDAIINNLYTQFACCYGQRIGKYVQAQKKGIQCKIDCKTKYLLMGLYVLRNWYNPSISFSYPLIYNPSNPPNYYNSALFLVNSNGDTSITNPILSSFLVESDTPEDLLILMQENLPSNYYASIRYVNAIPFMVIKILSPFPTQTWIYVQEHSVGGTPDINQFWFPAVPLSSCIPYSAIQNIIQNCIKICGCTNCLNLPALEADNIYTPIGIKSPAAIAGPTLYTNLPYFN